MLLLQALCDMRRITAGPLSLWLHTEYMDDYNRKRQHMFNGKHALAEHILNVISHVWHIPLQEPIAITADLQRRRNDNIHRLCVLERGQGENRGKIVQKVRFS